MEISSSTLTLQQFFSSSSEQFIIPAYQRRYAWEERQQRELFDDIRRLPPSDSHLLGTVLLLTDIYTLGINRLELVDGQQRVTTLAILLLVLAERFKADGNDGAALEIAQLLRCKGALDTTAQPKLVLGDLDQADFVRLMDKEDLEEVVNMRLKKAYELFTLWVGQLSDKELREFTIKLRDKTTIIRLHVGEAKDAYKLFETINNRGLRLRPTDIIKNFLLGHASSLSKEIYEKVRKQWSEAIAALDGVDSDAFFRQWLAGKLHRKVTKGQLVADFKHYYSRAVQEAEDLQVYAGALVQDEETDPEGEQEDVAVVEDVDFVSEVKVRKVKLTTFTTELRKAAKLYGDLLWANTESPKINRHLVNLYRIKAFQSYTLILNMFQRGILEEKDIISLLVALEAFMMRRHICEKRANELETIFASLTSIENEGYKKAVLATLREHTPDDEEFEAAFRTFPFVAAVINRARYALEMIEYHQIRSRNEYYLANPDDLHVEHIIPKAAEKSSTKAQLGDWPTYLGEEWKAKHTKQIHRIGNLTLLSSELNISASNNPFHAKRPAYRQSNIRITQEVGKYSQFKFKAVEDRSVELAELAVRIWKV